MWEESPQKIASPIWSNEASITETITKDKLEKKIEKPTPPEYLDILIKLGNFEENV